MTFFLKTNKIQIANHRLIIRTIFISHILLEKFAKQKADLKFDSKPNKKDKLEIKF